MKITYSIAGSNIFIDSCLNYELTESLSDFLTSKEKDIDIEIFIKKDVECIKPKGKLVYDDRIYKIYKNKNIFYRETYFMGKDRISIIFYNNEGRRKFNCYISEEFINKNWTVYDIFSMIGFDYLLFLNKTMILHSSFISYNKNGILFTAPSQTGKSTQADLWKKYRNAEIINGDRAAIKKENGKFYAYGLPYAGSSKIYKNKKEIIKAVIVLRQGKENKIRRLRNIEAFKYLYSETMVNTWNKDFVNGISDIITELISEVPVYMMYCLPNESAVNLLKEELNI